MRGKPLKDIKREPLMSLMSLTQDVKGVKREALALLAPLTMPGNA